MTKLAQYISIQNTITTLQLMLDQARKEYELIDANVLVEREIQDSLSAMYRMSSLLGKHLVGTTVEFALCAVTIRYVDGHRFTIECANGDRLIVNDTDLT